MLQPENSGAPVAVEQTEQPVQQEQIESPETGLEVPEEQKTEGKKRTGGWQRKLTRLERENAALQEKLAQFESKQPEATAEAPNIDNYSDYDSYLTARTAYEVQSALRKEREAQNKANQEQEERKKLEERDRSWEQKVESLDETYHDYDEVVGRYANVKVRGEILQAMSESDIGPQIAYFLAKNPEKLEAINKADASPFKIYKEISAIESKLSQPKPSVKVSKLPAPISPVGGSAATVVDYTNMDFDTYYSHRNKRI